MSDPRTGPTVRIVNHQAAGVLPPNAAIRCSPAWAKTTTGCDAAIAMMTTTNIGSVKLTPSDR